MNRFAFGFDARLAARGIAALLGVLMQVKDKASLIAFRGLNRHLEKIFRMTGFSALVQFEVVARKRTPAAPTGE